jgi:hypothetical protein
MCEVVREEMLMTRLHVQGPMWGASVLREVATASVNKSPTRSVRAVSYKMDFLKSAVASAISKGYPTWGYTFGDRVDIDDSIWTLYNGTKRVWP